MRRLAVLLAGAVIAAAPGIARAEQPRTPPEATQHALDEIENAMAQGKITATPTPTLPPTPRPTSTPIPPPVVPTDTPAPVVADEPTSEPCWATDELGDIRFREEDGTPISCDDWTASQTPIEAPSVEPVYVAPTATPLPVATPQPRQGNLPPQIPPLPPQVVYVYVPAPAVDTPIPLPTAPPRNTPVPYATSTMLPTRTPQNTPTSVPQSPLPTRSIRITPKPSPTPTKPPQRQIRRPFDDFHLSIPLPHGPAVPPTSAESWWDAALPARTPGIDMDSAA